MCSVAYTTNCLVYSGGVTTPLTISDATSASNIFATHPAAGHARTKANTPCGGEQPPKTRAKNRERCCRFARSYDGGLAPRVVGLMGRTGVTRIDASARKGRKKKKKSSHQNASLPFRMQPTNFFRSCHDMGALHLAGIPYSARSLSFYLVHRSSRPPAPPQQSTKRHGHIHHPGWKRGTDGAAFRGPPWANLGPRQTSVRELYMSRLRRERTHAWTIRTLYPEYVSTQREGGMSSRSTPRLTRRLRTSRVWPQLSAPEYTTTRIKLFKTWVFTSSFFFF